MTDYEQAYRDLRAGVEALVDRMLCPWDRGAVERLLASSSPATASEIEVCPCSDPAETHDAKIHATASEDWRDVPHVHAGTDCRGGEDCPARPEPCAAPPGNLCTETGCWDTDRCVVYPATASEGATELTGDESYIGDPCPEHGPHCHGDICCCADKHRPATGVTSSDGDRGLSEDPIPRCPHGAPTWACVDHPDEGQITVERAIEAWEEKGPTSLTVALMAEALYSAQCRLAACTAQLERVERVEWGVGCMLSGNLPHTGKAWKTKREAEESAERLRSIWRSGDAVESAIETIHVVRRTVTEYAPVVGPWEVVGDE